MSVASKLWFIVIVRYIGIDAVYRSQGEIPEVHFIKRIGVPDQFRLLHGTFLLT